MEIVICYNLFKNLMYVNEFGIYIRFYYCILLKYFYMYFESNKCLYFGVNKVRRDER